MRPMPVNSNQIKRILREPIGSGFLVYRSGEDEVEVAEFRVGDDGKLVRPDGSTFVYVLDVGGDRVEYAIVPNRLTQLSLV